MRPSRLLFLRLLRRFGSLPHRSKRPVGCGGCDNCELCFALPSPPPRSTRGCPCSGSCTTGSLVCSRAALGGPRGRGGINWCMTQLGRDFRGSAFTPLLFHTRVPNVAPEMVWIVLYGVSHSLGGCPLRSNGSATGIERYFVGCSGCVARSFDGDRGLDDTGGASESTASGGYSFFGTAIAGAAVSSW